MKKKISIYISFDGLNDPLGKSQIKPYLKKIKFKYLLKIFSLEKNLYLDRQLNNKKIKSHSIKFINSKFKITKLINYFNFFFFIIFKCLFYKIETIHCRGFPAAVFALIINFFSDSKIIYDMRGFWIDEKIDNNVLVKKNFIDLIIIKILKLLEVKIIRNAKSIIVLTYNSKNYIRRKFKRSKNIFVIPCSVDYSKFNYSNYKFKTKKIKKNLNFKKNSKILIYIGSYGKYYMINEMIILYSYLKRKFKSLNFLIVSNQKEKFINHLASNKNCNDIKIINADWSQIPKYLSISDISLCLIKPTFAKIASSPTKLSESLAMGVPVIANSKIGDLNKILNKEKFGCLININNINNVNNLKKINSLLKLKKVNVRKKSKNYYDINNAILKYNKVYEILN